MKKTIVIAILVLMAFGGLKAQSSYWSMTGNTISNPIPINPYFLGTTNSYPLQFRTNNLCRMYISTSGDEGVSDTPLRVWPNPTDDLLFVELRGAEIASVALYDLQGRVVETCHGASLQGGTATVNMRNVPAGVYVLRVTDAEGQEHQSKVVKR